MLDTATKRRIDTARDILVGKVPNPQSQVEQITIALIYKFMDDMDAEAEELGGHRKFFAGDYACYGWAKLMRSGLGGHETLNLYAEAIARMPENPGIPPLFRDIFKNAYLPYRDPETLRAFLKIIDEFEYDHSERLGDAFEYLLSVLGSQGDAGQFRTPRHIIDFIVAVLDPQKHETVLDPACGTAGFLISAWKHILKHNSSPSPLAGDDCMDAGGRTMPGAIAEGRGDPGRSRSGAGDSPSPLAGDDCMDAGGRAMPGAIAEGRGEGSRERAGDLLTPDERGRLARNFKGYDISPDMVRLSLVNLYLHGFTDPHIFEYDCLTSQERWNETADVILANPPFMSPKGGIRPHNRFSVQSKRSEVLFVDYMAEHLTPNGRAGIIVPEGIIFQSQGAYRQLRKLLVEDYLIAVVSLPAGVFQPYSGVKTSILILDKALARSSDSIAFFKVQNDGFGLGAQRRAIDKNDLPAAAAALQAFRHSRPRSESSAGANGNPGAAAVHVSRHSRASGNPVDLDPSHYPGLLVVEKSRIAANGDYNLSGERYREGGERAHVFPLVPLGDICTINPRKAQLVDLPPDTPVSFVPMADVNEHRIAFHASEEKLLSEVSASYTYFEDDDVLLAKVTPCFENGKAGIARNLRNGIGFGSSEFYVLRGCGQVLPEWVYFCVMHPLFRDDAIAQMTGTGGLQRVPRDYVENFRIPLPPLEVQKEIVAEIEGYQKVIDGARAVLDHYRPHIPIHPDWPMVPLGDIADVKLGKMLDQAKHQKGQVLPYVRNVSVRWGTIDTHDLPEMYFEEDELERFGLQAGDVLVCEGGEPGRAAVWDGRMLNLKYQKALHRVRFKVPFEPSILVHLLQEMALSGALVGWLSGTTIKHLTLESFSRLPIPLPPLATQQAIVAEIEAEQTLVNANRELIARFEQKIQATLARVWGEDEPAPAEA